MAHTANPNPEHPQEEHHQEQEEQPERRRWTAPPPHESRAKTAKKNSPPLYLRRYQVGEPVWYRNPLTENVWAATIVRVLSAHPDGTWPYLVHVQRGGGGDGPRMQIVYHNELQDRRDGAIVERPVQADGKPQLAYYRDDVRY